MMTLYARGARHIFREQVMENEPGTSTLFSHLATLPPRRALERSDIRNHSTMRNRNRLPKPEVI